MSKYADIEQIKEVIRTEWVKYMPMDLDMNLSFVLGKISEVPTIEVSEDCISRADLIESFLADNECKREDAKACMCKLDLMLELIEDAQSVVPKQSTGKLDLILKEEAVNVLYDNFASTKGLVSVYALQYGLRYCKGREQKD